MLLKTKSIIYRESNSIILLYIAVFIYSIIATIITAKNYNLGLLLSIIPLFCIIFLANRNNIYYLIITLLYIINFIPQYEITSNINTHGVIILSIFLISVTILLFGTINKSYNIFNKTIILPLLILTIYSLGSLIFSPYRSYGIRYFVHFIGVYYIALSFMNYKGNKRNFIIYLYLLGLILIICQFYIIIGNISIIFEGSPENIFKVLNMHRAKIGMLTIIFIANNLLLLKTTGDKRIKHFLIITITIASICIVLNNTRIVLISFLFFFTSYFIFQKKIKEVSFTPKTGEVG